MIQVLSVTLIHIRGESDGIRGESDGIRGD